jgi:hypothetical protein
MLGFGALEEFSLADFGNVNPVVSVVLPPVSMALAARQPKQASGVAFNAPISHLSLAALAGEPITGRLIGLPSSPVAVLLPAPKALPGKFIGLPLRQMGLSALFPDIQTGRVINLADTVTVSAGVGALAGSALCEFALGEGEAIAATFTIPVRLKIAFPVTAAQPGKNFAASIIPITLHAPLPETDARSRAIRINAIAS